ncbi:unnamed protein product [Cuscuta epithymum]|uniref:Uncharacterized protein n=1 Tax=Cuscuta epithymum TaxID=186058 RepID=A0AAV0CYJ3_9ASTE|nr:unnamed protein product [Cuscuta epithymum]
MNWKLASSISHFPGYFNFRTYLATARNIWKTLPVQRRQRPWEMLKLSSQTQWIGSSNRSFHSSSKEKEDDSFMELGPAMNETDVSELKLSTEKRERFRWQNGSVRKSLANKGHLVNKRVGEKETHDVSDRIMAQLLDVFGAKRPAGKVNHVGRHGEPHQTMVEPYHLGGIISTIRINGINKCASNNEIHSLCRKVGNLERLTWVGKAAVDAYFRVGSESESIGIVTKLNGHTIGGRHLAASIPSGNSTKWIPKKK